MGMLEELKGLGVDVDEGLERVMGDSSLYEMMLGMFVDAVKNNPISPEEFGGADMDGLISRSHMLKGTTGNLAITPLFKGYTKVLEALRAGQAAEAKAEFERLLPAQEKIIACIQGNMGA